jgi:hypothetical protein
MLTSLDLILTLVTTLQTVDAASGLEASHRRELRITVIGRGAEAFLH